jgi:hypothetical protein
VRFKLLILIILNTGRSYGAKIIEELYFYKQYTPTEFGFPESLFYKQYTSSLGGRVWLYKVPLGRESMAI